MIANAASEEEQARLEHVVGNAREQLLRAKGQVARLQAGGPVSNSGLSHGVRPICLSPIMATIAGADRKGVVVPEPSLLPVAIVIGIERSSS